MGEDRRKGGKGEYCEHNKGEMGEGVLCTNYCYCLRRYGGATAPGYCALATVSLPAIQSYCLRTTTTVPETVEVLTVASRRRQNRHH